MSKKTKILVFSVILTLCLAFIPFSPKGYSNLFVGLFIFASGLFAAISLWDYLSGIEYITLLSLPVLFSLGMGSIILQFPNFSVFFKIIFFFVYFLVYYILLLSLNIFNVASEKTIPLLRAAYTTSFLVTSFSAFPLLTLIYKLNLNILLEIFLVFLLFIILCFQSLWTAFLPKNVINDSLKASFTISWLMVQTALVFSFFPIESFFRSLLISTFFYIYLGFTHQYLKRSINYKSILEYSIVGIVITAFVFLY